MALPAPWATEAREERYSFWETGGSYIQRDWASQTKATISVKTKQPEPECLMGCGRAGAAWTDPGCLRLMSPNAREMGACMVKPLAEVGSNLAKDDIHEGKELSKTSEGLQGVDP